MYSLRFCTCTYTLLILTGTASCSGHGETLPTAEFYVLCSQRTSFFVLVLEHDDHDHDHDLHSFLYNSATRSLMTTRLRDRIEYCS